ncbi:histidine utilization repressor [Bradyrhizobium lablabi]|uniref:histidine utilization repressor n=1 Tax=Bradyrhizobium lablabi TaxID=722472 RepID=UPI001BA9A3E1|nr:histidine utilization repressor [Bradyrhizobium lablabi]MBR0697716.1 histidine utilization repressor [Bradyrhizobium lablabi]
MTAPSKRGANAGVALYQRIRSDIEGRIVSGEWPPGHRLPFEHELMDTYSCARMTVNKVLSGLAAAGLVERKRRAGSFVSRPKVHSAVLQIPDLKAEVESRGQRYGYALLQRQKRTATREDKARLDLDLRAPILALRCRHDAAKQPFALEDRILNLDAVPDAAQQDFSEVPPSTWLVDHVPWTEAEHRISAGNADEALAADLNIDVGTACLIIERRTWRNGQPITAVRLVHPGPLYDLTARFTPSG